MTINFSNKEYIGVTERGDAGLDLSWTEKMDTVKFAIIISKQLNDKLIDELINFKDKIIFHHTVTGMGGGKIEPNVPNMSIALQQTCKLIELGFPVEQIVLRIDPIIPTQKGITTAYETMVAFCHTTRIKRVRYSFLDMYPHVKERFKRAKITLPYISFTAPEIMRNNALGLLIDTAEKLSVELESCAENTPHKTGCISKKDADILRINIDLKGRGYQRADCCCAGNKLELLNNRKQCQSKCLYCYWK